MQVRINKKPMELSEGTTLSQVGEEMKVPEKGVAIAVNGSIIHRDKWTATVIKDGDEILIIKAFCGG